MEPKKASANGGAFALVRGGAFDDARIRDVLGSGRYPARRPDDNVADLEAMVAANRAGGALLEATGQMGAPSTGPRAASGAFSATEAAVGALGHGGPVAVAAHVPGAREVAAAAAAAVRRR